jgi:putative MATE family efflux protein
MTSLALSFTDMFMFGLMEGVSETAIAASRIAHQPFYLFHMILFGSMSGASVLCSQYWGKKDIRTINAVAGTTFLLMLPVCAVFISVSFIFAPQLMPLFSNDPDVIAEAVIYLRIIAFSFIFELVTTLFSGILRSVENVKVPMFIGIGGISVNIILNALLIFGLAGLPAMGIQGAAAATFITQFLRMAGMLIYIIFIEKTVRFNIKKMLNIKKVLIKDFFKIGPPVIANEFIWGLGTSVHMAIIGRISSEAQSAYIVSSMLEQIAAITMIHFSTVCCVIIGKSIGEGKPKDIIAHYSRTFIGLACAAAVFTGGLTFIFRHFIINLFELKGETQAYVSQLFLVAAAALIIKTFNCVSVVGIFRGGGDTKTGMIIDLLAMYLAGIPAGFCAMYYFGLSVPFVYAFLIIDELVKLPIYFILVKRRKWIRNITREF